MSSAKETITVICVDCGVPRELSVRGDASRYEKPCQSCSALNTWIERKVRQHAEKESEAGQQTIGGQETT